MESVRPHERARGGLEVTGDSQPVLPDALDLDQLGSSVDPVSVAPNGTIAYSSGELNPVQTLTWIDRSGRRNPTPLRFAILAGGSEAVALSPDERRIAVARPQDGLSHLWVYDLESHPTAGGWWCRLSATVRTSSSSRACPA